MSVSDIFCLHKFTSLSYFHFLQQPSPSHLHILPLVINIHSHPRSTDFVTIKRIPKHYKLLYLRKLRFTMTKSHRSFMFVNRDAVLNELHLLCPTARLKNPSLDLVFSVLYMNPHSAAQKTHDFNQFGQRENASLQF